ncbi:2187_t:CDS:2 [Paraglomus brasilianum]|uniref:2187_t:CDS:1 n=1 Tax=Paraglomus brasilianum TaxID=144538 RepID=A0A9N9G7K5_9GLOM|nr:2187_t:CDS:2 [Paraglomus brasilianum]
MQSQALGKNAHTLGVLPSILILVSAFGIGAASVYLAFDSLLSDEMTLGDVKALHTGLSNADDAALVLCYITVYIFLQSFAIPGSVMLSVLGGTLWGTLKALALVGFCSATGATICYFLSYYLGQSVTRVYLAERMKQWNEQLENHKQHLFSYIVFLRVTPFLPNWFINIASPHMNVGINTFYWATFFGVMPLSFIHVQAGETIHRITETDNFTFLTPQNVLTMTMIAVAALIPIIIRRKFEKKEKAE